MEELYQTSHLLKQQIAEGLRKLAVLHQQEVAQNFKMSFHPQIHEEVVHHCLVHQRHTGDTKEDSGRQRCFLASATRVVNM